MSERDELATVIHRRICEESLSECLEDEGYCVKAASEVLAAGYSKPRTITTVAELEALPSGSIIRDDLGFAWQKYNKPISDKPAWFAATRDTGFYFSSNFIDGNRVPLMVLFEAAS